MYFVSTSAPIFLCPCGTSLHHLDWLWFDLLTSTNLAVTWTICREVSPVEVFSEESWRYSFIQIDLIWLQIGDEIEVRPGIVTKDAEGKVKCVPIFSRIVSLFAEENDLKFAVPGGLIGVGTKIDPTLCRADRLVGQVQLFVSVYLLVRFWVKLESFPTSLLSWRSTSSYCEDCWESRQMERNRAEYWKSIATSDLLQVQKLQKGEVLMVNIGSTSTGGRVLAVKQDLAKIVLIQPVCTQEGEKIALSRRVEKHWR